MSEEKKEGGFGRFLKNPKSAKIIIACGAIGILLIFISSMWPAEK